MELPVAEYNRLRDVETDYIKAGDQYHKGQEHMAKELLMQISDKGFDMSIGAASNAGDVLKDIIYILREIVRRAK